MTPAGRRALTARAHSLNPILQLGTNGLTDAVLAEIDRALTHHELIKVRAAALNRDERAVALAGICERTGAQAVQHIGKILILYREKPAQAQAPAPRPRPPRRAGDERPPRRTAKRARRRGAPQRPQRRRSRA